MKEKMVVGFVFNEIFTRCLLIRKNRPKWMEGLLNGIGGHIEEGETPEEAMKRECFEECGLEISNWKEICIMSGENWSVDVFAATADLYGVKTKTDEEIVEFSMFDIIYLDKCVPNVNWLLPMCVEHMNNTYTFKEARFRY